ncbi:MAG: hypothetical protein QMC62_15585 [Alteromonadaceae bacterium]
MTNFVCCAKLTQKLGYDGVEIMGTEGYFINPFIVKRTDQRTDKWGEVMKTLFVLHFKLLKKHVRS